MPFVFGRKFSISVLTTILLAFSAFFKIIRGNPFTSLLLHHGRTKALAIGNLATFTGLASPTFLVWLYPSVNAVLVGRILGEISGLVIITLISITDFQPGLTPLYVTSSLGVLFIVLDVVTFSTFNLDYNSKLSLLLPSIYVLTFLAIAVPKSYRVSALYFVPQEVGGDGKYLPKRSRINMLKLMNSADNPVELASIKGSQFKYSICTMVTKPEMYKTLLNSFGSKGLTRAIASICMLITVQKTNMTRIAR